MGCVVFFSPFEILKWHVLTRALCYWASCSLSFITLDGLCQFFWPFENSKLTRAHKSPLPLGFVFSFLYYSRWVVSIFFFLKFWSDTCSQRPFTIGLRVGFGYWDVLQCDVLQLPQICCSVFVLCWLCMLLFMSCLRCVCLLQMCCSCLGCLSQMRCSVFVVCL